MICEVLTRSLRLVWTLPWSTMIIMISICLKAILKYSGLTTETGYWTHTIEICLSFQWCLPLCYNDNNKYIIIIIIIIQYRQNQNNYFTRITIFSLTPQVLRTKQRKLLWTFWCIYVHKCQYIDFLLCWRVEVIVKYRDMSARFVL